MIRHIVMWKLDEEYGQDEKRNKIEAFTNRLMGLKGKIKELKTISVHINSSNANASNFDILLDTSFNSMEELKAYALHAEHVRVVEFAHTIRMERACVDYEF